MKYGKRLKLAAQALARAVAEHRADRDSNPLALAIYEARLSAVTVARRRWGAWIKAHPGSTLEQRNAAKRELGLPVTRRECLAQIERIHLEVERTFRGGERRSA